MTPKNITTPQNSTLDFPEALRQLIAGSRITRLEWNDPQTYGLLHNGFLMLYKADDGLLHQWLVNDGDLFATDWTVIPSPIPNWPPLSSPGKQTRV